MYNNSALRARKGHSIALQKAGPSTGNGSQRLFCIRSNEWIEWTGEASSAVAILVTTSGTAEELRKGDVNMRIFTNVTKNVLRSIVFGVALLGAGGAVTAAQAQYGPHMNYADRGDRDRAFQDGYNRGRFDGQHNRAYRPETRAWRDDWARSAFRSGYDRGYRDFHRNGVQFRFNFGR
jgi:hypothetical protein